MGARGSYSMGLVQSGPRVVADGTIELRYMGGETCHKGRADESQRSTTIHFYCSQREVRGGDEINYIY